MSSSKWLGIVSRRFVLVLTVLLMGTVDTPAQIPDQFTNLKILPKDISKRDLINVMRGYADALGFRCHNCHVGEPGPSLDGYDFVSDKKEEKVVARQMMKMVQEINEKHIANLKTRHDPGIDVSCRTCHHGQERPRTLPDVLGEVHEKKGIEATLAKYTELRENYYGRDSFDFGEWALDDLVQTIAMGGKLDDAKALIELHAASEGESSHFETLLGELEFRGGDKKLARTHFKRALELDPNNRAAKHRLEQMEKED